MKKNLGILLVLLVVQYVSSSQNFVPMTVEESSMPNLSELQEPFMASPDPVKSFLNSDANFIGGTSFVNVTGSNNDLTIEFGSSVVSNKHEVSGMNDDAVIILDGKRNLILTISGMNNNITITDSKFKANSIRVKLVGMNNDVAIASRFKNTVSVKDSGMNNNVYYE